MWQVPVGKMMFRVNPDDMPMIEKYAAEHPSDQFIGFKTNMAAFEFTDPRASKGVALQKFCEKQGIDIKESFAFGDTTNDNAMISMAGVGVCLLNGTDDTKALADYITDKTCEEDGFADWVEKNIFIPNGWEF